MIRIYLTAPQLRTMVQIGAELLGEGMSKECIHVYSARPAQTAPTSVDISAYSPPSGPVVVGGFIGTFIGALLGLPLLGLGILGIAPLLVIMVAGGVGGALLKLWLLNGPSGEFYHIDDALKRGETVMVLEIDKWRVSEVESKVKSRHPEVSVLDVGSRRTPPFP